MRFNSRLRMEANSKIPHFCMQFLPNLCCICQFFFFSHLCASIFFDIFGISVGYCCANLSLFFVPLMSAQFILTAKGAHLVLSESFFR